jgi:hypothetical protein
MAMWKQVIYVKGDLNCERKGKDKCMGERLGMM